VIYGNLICHYSIIAINFRIVEKNGEQEKKLPYKKEIYIKEFLTSQ